MEPKRCKCGCGRIVKGHPNKKFFNQRHKDRYWNRVNPRGKFAHLNPDDESFESYNQHYYRTTHPFDSEALGQD